MSKTIKIITLVLLVGFLMLIRMFEASLFYDPLIVFFKSDYKNNPLPEFNYLQLLSSIVMRYFMNTVISLAILWVAFKDVGVIKISSLLYAILLVVLIVSFSYLLFYSETKNFLPLFYVRRFLIQPIFLLVLLPAFYFQKNKK